MQSLQRPAQSSGVGDVELGLDARGDASNRRSPCSSNRKSLRRGIDGDCGKRGELGIGTPGGEVGYLGGGELGGLGQRGGSMGFGGPG